MTIDPLEIAADVDRLIPKDVDRDRERDKAKEAEIFKALVQPSPNDVVIEPIDQINRKRAVADNGEGRHGYTLAASCVRRKKVQWLWEGRIMLGGVNLLVGEGGASASR